MARLATLAKGDWEAFERFLAAKGLSAEDVLALNEHPSVIDEMLKTMRAQPAFRLIHGMFTPLADKVAMVKAWPGVKAEDVDVAIEEAKKSGLIAGYEAEVVKNKLLDIVISVYQATVHDTLLYARARFMEAFPEKYDEWKEAYASGVDENRVKLIDGAHLFTPNKIVVEVVDFGANWDRKNGLILRNVQQTQANQLAGFAVLFNAPESPEWVRKMDGEKIPYALAAALLLNVPEYGAWSYSPNVCHRSGKAKLFGLHVDSKYYGHAMPVLREYRK